MNQRQRYLNTAILALQRLLGITMLLWPIMLGAAIMRYALLHPPTDFMELASEFPDLRWDLWTLLPLHVGHPVYALSALLAMIAGGWLCRCPVRWWGIPLALLAQLPMFFVALAYFLLFF